MSEEPQSFPPVASERQAQLESLIAGYIRETEAGRTPQRQELLKQYPEFAAELTQFFGQRDRLNRLVDPIREFGDDLYQSIGPGKQLSYVGNYLHFRRKGYAFVYHRISLTDSERGVS